MCGRARWAFLVLVGLAGSNWADAEGPPPLAEASAPQAVTLSVYDAGPTLVQELRRVTLQKGENLVRIARLPARADPTTLALTAPDGSALSVRDLEFVNDLCSVRAVLERYLGYAVEVETREGVRQGRLLSIPAGPGAAWDRSPLAISGTDGRATVFPQPESISALVLPELAARVEPEPTVRARVEAVEEGPINLRVHYATEGLSWAAYYDLRLAPDGATGSLSVRVRVQNDSGTAYENARVRLVATERGIEAMERARWPAALQSSPLEAWALRYAYGREDPTFAAVVASPVPLATWELPQPVGLARGETRFVELHRAERVPVEMFYVYDGVRFDRFPRNPRTDWTYGTECHTAVETYLQFANTERSGLGTELPPGRLRVLRPAREGGWDLLGEDVVRGVPAGGTAHVRVGPALGLRGERERTGYAEVVPLHQYEESFEIRLENLSSEDVEVRVVEHLYRATDYEVVKADAEATQTAPQTIEFRPLVKAGGKRSIHYTVRYTW